LVEEKDKYIFKYQHQKLLTDIHPKSEEIYKHLSELAKENRLHMKSVQDNIAWSRCERTINTIVEKNYQEILKMVSPEQVEKLIKQRERERVREHLKIR